jgi:molybdopterin converting factor small subunit
MGTETAEYEPTDENTDTVRALAEAYARIERVEETTDEYVNELETAKNAILAAQDRFFDAEVSRVREELSDGDCVDE